MQQLAGRALQVCMLLTDMHKRVGMELFVRYIFFVAFLALFGCSEKSGSMYAEHISEPSCKPIIAVYPVWKHSNAELKSLPWNDFTHIAISSIYPMSTGELHSQEADLFLDTLVSLAHSKDKKVIISVGGAGKGSQGFVELYKNHERVTEFVSNLLLYVEHHKIDGIDIDWEYWTYQHVQGKSGNDPIESQQLVDLVKRLKATMKPELLLTVDIMAGHWVGEQYLPELQKHADYVNLMAFDFTGAWPESAIGYHSDYSTFIKSIEFVLDRGFNRNQVLVGVPAYGIEFENASNNTINHHSYRSIVNELDGNLADIAKEKFNNIYFESPQTIKKKFSYVKDELLGGIFMFEVTSDHRSPEHSLLKSAQSIINDNCPNNELQ
ncbi:glycoside hydrolase family 18 protein [Pseudoalteromonas holothuriae]|nr:glycoside hydrolase family 18 protein [Pseudoalteromonas sp. CIP111951]